MNEIVEFKKSRKRYTVSFIYPDRVYEFESITDKTKLLRFPEQTVSDWIIEKEIISIKRM